MSDDFVDKRRKGSSKYDVINIKEKVYGVRTMMKGKERAIRLAAQEDKFGEINSKALIPGTMGLFNVTSRFLSNYLLTP